MEFKLGDQGVLAAARIREPGSEFLVGRVKGRQQAQGETLRIENIYAPMPSPAEDQRIS